jgi:FlgD Ig-like domain
MSRAVGAFVAFLCALAIAGGASAQVPGSSSSASGGGFELGDNYPNPFNPETTIPFVLGDELFADGRPVVVSVRIFNLLGQPVAWPVALSHPAGAGVETRQLEYAQPGRYEAFWDGTDQSGRQVSSGIYFVQLTVNGVSKAKKITIYK